MSKIFGLHIPSEIKNLAINGGMDFFQRTEANVNTVTASTSSTLYTADMFAATSSGSSAKSYTLQRSTNIPTAAQSGIQGTYSLLFTMTTALSSFATGDNLSPVQYRMEGLDFAKIHQKTATFGFWINVSVAGTYSFSLRNAAITRSYVTSFAASVGWQFVTVSVPMDQTSSWTFDNNNAMYVDIGSFTGTQYQTATLGSWQAGNFFCASTAVNYAATAGATINVTQFSIVEGPLGFASTGFQRAGKDISQELTMCQRYYEKSYAIGTAPGSGGAPTSIFWRPQSTDWHQAVYFKTVKRAPGTANNYSPSSGAINAIYSNDGAADRSTPSPGSTAFSMDIGNATNTASQLTSAHFTVDCGL